MHTCFRVPGIYTALKPDFHINQFTHVLEYLEFTQLSNRCSCKGLYYTSFRVPGIYTALKRMLTDGTSLYCFRVPGIYTALKLLTPWESPRGVLEYLEFTQLSNKGRTDHRKTDGFRVPGIYTALKLLTCKGVSFNSFRVPGIYTALKPQI